MTALDVLVTLLWLLTVCFVGAGVLALIDFVRARWREAGDVINGVRMDCTRCGHPVGFHEGQCTACYCTAFVNDDDVAYVHTLADVDRVRAFTADRAVITTDWDAELRELIGRES